MIEMASKTELRTTESESPPIDCESLTDQVWQDLNRLAACNCGADR